MCVSKLRAPNKRGSLFKQQSSTQASFVEQDWGKMLVALVRMCELLSKHPSKCTAKPQQQQPRFEQCILEAGPVNEIEHAETAIFLLK